MTSKEWEKVVSSYNEKISNILNPYFKNIYKDSYYGCVFEDEKKIQIGIGFYKMTENIELTISELTVNKFVSSYKETYKEQYSIQDKYLFFKKINEIKIKKQLKALFN
jgi:hypothetical protein